MARYTAGNQVMEFDSTLSLGSNYKAPIKGGASQYYGDPDYRPPQNRPYEYPSSRKYPAPVYHQSVIAHKQSRTQAAAYEEAQKPFCKCTRGLVIGLVVAGLIVVLAAVLITLYFTGVIFNYYSKPVEFPKTPPMGWRSGGAFFCDGLSQGLVESTSTQLVNLGYRDAGYNIVILDDCWQSKRNSSGVLTPDLSMFPAGNIGMRNLARRLSNEQGIDMGFHTSVGSLSCMRRPGGHGLQDRDMAIYGDWKAVFIHGDDCFIHPSTSRPAANKELGDNLKRLQHPVIHSVSSSVGAAEVEGEASIARVKDYILDEWYEMLAVVDLMITSGDTRKAKPGFFIDPGPMSIGMGGMEHQQYVTLFSLWCALKFPLIMANDVSKAGDALTRGLLQNPEVIAVNQDLLAEAVVRISRQPVVPQSRDKMNLVVSAPCAQGDPAQQWHIEEFEERGYRRFFNPSRDLCLGWEADGRTKSSLCFESDPTLRWTFPYKVDNQTHPVDSEEDCLTISTTPRVAARVRGCDERKNTRDWQGENKWWHGFNDVTWIEEIGGTEEKKLWRIRNENDQCLALGLEEYWETYAGRLTDNRFIVLLVNRDSEDHRLTFTWSEIPGMIQDRPYNVRELHERTALGQYINEFTGRVLGHSTLMLELTDAL